MLSANATLRADWAIKAFDGPLTPLGGGLVPLVFSPATLTFALVDATMLNELRGHTR